MAKVLARLGAVLAAACCAGAGPALAQPHHGVAAAPAPHISAPAAPHIAAPAVPHVSAPHFSAPAPHVAATPRFAVTPHFNVGRRFNATPHIATPRFSARTPGVHQFTARGHTFAPRGFARQATHGPIGRRLAGRSVRRPTEHTFAGRNLTRHATRTTRGANRTLARTNRRTNRQTDQANRAVTTGRNETANARNNEVNTRNGGNARNEALNGRNRTGAGNRNHVTGAEYAALSRPLGARNRDFNDRHRFFHHRRQFGLGGFVGWFGPVFWPYAYDDLFDYAFWPYEYDDYGFWDYAYDDLLDSVFWNPGTEDIYASVGRGRYASVEKGGGTATRARRERAYRAAAQTCRQDAGFAQWPVEEIAQVVQPTQDQQRLLDDLKAASNQAAKLLQASCPAQQPSTPLGRLDAIAQRLNSMLQAVDIVRPALAKFYDSLSDEQKARFNEMGQQQAANQGAGNGKNEARVCGGQGPGILSDQAIDRIDSEVRPNDQQKANLDALHDASAKAADALRNACPSQTPITPVARLDAMAKRIQAMLDAINTVRPALAKFYDSLSDEQKAHFNIMARNQ